LKIIAQLIKPYPKKRHPIKEKDAFGTRLRMRKGVSIPIYESKSGLIRWSAQGYAKLIMEGSYKTGERRHRSDKRTGRTSGIGNKLKQAQSKFAPIMTRAWTREIKRSAIRAGYNAMKRRTRQNKLV